MCTLWAGVVRAICGRTGVGYHFSGLGHCVWQGISQGFRYLSQVNASWLGDVIRQYHSVDINMAVQTDLGLFIPLIQNVDRFVPSPVLAWAVQIVQIVDSRSEWGGMAAWALKESLPVSKASPD